MLVDTRDAAISPWIVLDGLWETQVTSWLQHSLRPGQTFVDVGANVGYFTLLGAQLVGPQGKVVAVEAHGGLAELLRRNVIMNGFYGYVTTWHRAAWSVATQLQLHQRLNFSGASSVGAIGPEALERLGDTEEMVEVQAVPLDDLLVGLPPVDVLKMDIEGAELQAFTGLSRTLEESRNISVMFEWAPALMEAVGDKAEALLDLIEGHGLRMRLLEDDAHAHRTRQASRSGLRERRRGTLMPPDASVVVVSYHPGDWLAPCCHRCWPRRPRWWWSTTDRRGTKPPRSRRRWGPTSYGPPANLGFAGGVALGLRHARGELIGVLNDDAVAAAI